MPDSVCSTVDKVVKTVKQGLMATGRAKTWGLDEWPLTGVSQPLIHRVLLYDFKAVIMNGQQKIIGEQIFRIAGGCLTSTVHFEGRKYAGEGSYIESYEPMPVPVVNYARPIYAHLDVVFPAVDPYTITDNLSIRITPLGCTLPDTIQPGAADKLNILTEADFARLPAEKRSLGSGLEFKEDGPFFRYTTVAYSRYYYLWIAGRASRGEVNAIFPMYSNQNQVNAILPIYRGEVPIVESFGGIFEVSGHFTSIVIPDGVIKLYGGGIKSGALSVISIGANVICNTLNTIYFRGYDYYDEGGRFEAFYNRNGKKAGTYTYTINGWSYNSKR
jgi:hypothetical protein